MAKKIKFKKTNKVGENNKTSNKIKFPSIYRIIPEKITDSYVFIAALLFILICALIVTVDLYNNLSLEKRLVGQASELQKKLAFWKNQTIIRPGYRDAYFNLALIEYQLKDYSASRDNLEKALNIDPNFEKGREFQRILSEGL